MEVNATTTEIEQQEIDKIDAMLHKLWKQKLLTDFDCRIIASSNNTLVGKKAAVYTAIMSKSKEKAAILTEYFRKVTVAIHGEEGSQSLHNCADSQNEGNDDGELLPRNPFLINTIIKHFFQFLPLDDLKRSRLVCHQWNSTAEICLRKRSTILFDLDVLPPHVFIEVSKYCLPDVPFPSFVFSNDEDSNWQISKIEDFFKKYGKNIKEVSFKCLTLTTKCNLTDREVLIPYYNVTPLFINPLNITGLSICSTYNEGSKRVIFDISLEKFLSIKTLSLKECRLIVSEENQITRIAPLSIDFDSVCIMQNGETATHLHYNDLIDFSNAVNISMDNYEKLSLGPIFDMGKQVLNVKQLHLSHFEVENWSLAKGDVQFLVLYSNHFLQRNHLKIKELHFQDSEIDLSALPETLEILKCQNKVFCSKQVYLPNLKYLYIQAECNIDSLPYFSNCPLVELEITSYNSYLCTETFNLNFLPKSLKRLEMPLTKVEFHDNRILKLDTLILKGSICNSGLKHCKAITAQIKAKVLVIECDRYIIKSRIIQLVLANNQTKKILIGSDSDLHKRTPFEGSELSKYVDNKSNYYQFENNFGKSITKAHFKEFTKMNCFCESDHFN